MTQLIALVAIGTAATVLATFLVLMRANFLGRRPVRDVKKALDQARSAQKEATETPR